MVTKDKVEVVASYCGCVPTGHILTHSSVWGSGFEGSAVVLIAHDKRGLGCLNGI